MKIIKLELKNFKRFDDLTIDLTQLEEPAKLVLLIGANGAGKSSVFDTFELINKLVKNNFDQPREYYRKKTGTDFSINVTTDLKENNNENLQISIVSKGEGIQANRISGQIPGVTKASFYGRTSVRQIPRLTRTSLGGGSFSFEEDTDRPKAFIDRDNRFENDIEKVTSLILSDVFKGDTSTAQIRESYINPINRAFENILGSEKGTNLQLVSIKPPLEGKTAEIMFEKGNSQIPYDYLSSGEKEIFNILINLLTRCEYFQDTIYFLDEIDLHLNTALQKNLLKEITENWIPDNCQLWVASHSLGFIDYANEAEHAAIIDFDNLNFDLPQIIYPSDKKNFDVFEIAVSKEFLATLFEGKRIIFSENTDTPLYNNLNIANTIFFNAKNRDDVFYKTKNNPTYNGLVDRDYLIDTERSDLLQRYKNLYILNYYSIENYLFHPDNLEEFYNSINKNFNKDEYRKSIYDEKQKVKDTILLNLAITRDSYPYYRENENTERLKSIRANNPKFLEMLNSDDFETFYKVLPAKAYGTKIKERQNINKADLAKTEWFKAKIEEVLQK